MVLEVIYIFAGLAGIIFFGFISELLFKKTRIPDVLLLMIIGILLGYVFHIVDPSSFGIGASLFTTFALVFILFQGALSLDFKTLFHTVNSAFFLVILGFFLTSAAIASVGYFFLGFDLLFSILLGVILGGTASAVVVPVVRNLPIDDKYKSILTLESAFTDVFCIVGAITVMSIMSTGEVGASSIFRSVFSSFLMSGAVGILAGLIWVGFLSKSTEFRNSHMITIAAVISIYAFVESPLVGANGAIAALAFGLILGNSQSLLRFSYKIKNGDSISPDKPLVIESVLSSEAKNFYSEISFFVKVFFFVYLGLLIDFSDYMIYVYGAILTLIIILVRWPASRIALLGESQDSSVSKKIVLVLMPRGLAAALLAKIAVDSNIANAPYLSNLVFSVILISISLSSILVFFIARAEEKRKDSLQGSLSQRTR